MYYLLCSIPSIYTEYEETLSRMSPEDDLREYAINHGTGMSYTWPDFEVHCMHITDSGIILFVTSVNGFHKSTLCVGFLEGFVSSTFSCYYLERYQVVSSSITLNMHVKCMDTP